MNTPQLHLSPHSSDIALHFHPYMDDQLMFFCHHQQSGCNATREAQIEHHLSQLVMETLRAKSFSLCFLQQIQRLEDLLEECFNCSLSIITGFGCPNKHWCFSSPLCYDWDQAHLVSSLFRTTHSPTILDSMVDLGATLLGGLKLSHRFLQPFGVVLEVGINNWSQHC